MAVMRIRTELGGLQKIERYIVVAASQKLCSKYYFTFRGNFWL